MAASRVSRSAASRARAAGQASSVDEVEVAHGDQAGRGLREAVPPAVLVVEVVVGPDRLLVDDHGEPVQHADRGEHLPGEAPGPVGVQHGERRVVGQQRAQRGVGEHQLVGAGGRAVDVGQGERGQLLRGGRARRRAARAPLRPAARCRARPRRRRPNARRRPATPGAPAAPRDRRGWRRAGRAGGGRRRGRRGAGRERRAPVGSGPSGSRTVAGPAAVRPSTRGTGRARRSSTSPGTTSASSPSSAYSARHHDGGRSTPNSRSTSSAAVTRRAPSSVSAAGR